MNEIPGLRFVGYASHPRVNHGEPLPLFEPVAPKDRPSINTVEGRNARKIRGRWHLRN